MEQVYRCVQSINNSVKSEWIFSAYGVLRIENYCSRLFLELLAPEVMTKFLVIWKGRGHVLISIFIVPVVVNAVF